MKRLLLGDEAIALGAIHAGLSGVYALSLVRLQLKLQNLYRQTLWHVNVAYTAVGVLMKRQPWKAALGMSYAG